MARINLQAEAAPVRKERTYFFVRAGLVYYCTKQLVMVWKEILTAKAPQPFQAELGSKSPLRESQ